MNDVCPLELSQQEYDDVQQCEAVVVREYEREDGSRFGQLVAWGDEVDMNDQCKMPVLSIVLNGVSIVCQRVILVSELLGGN